MSKNILVIDDEELLVRSLLKLLKNTILRLLLQRTDRML